MTEPSDDERRDRTDAPDAAGTPEPRRVFARPHPNETAEEFSSLLVAEILAAEDLGEQSGSARD